MLYAIATRHKWYRRLGVLGALTNRLCTNLSQTVDPHIAWYLMPIIPNFCPQNFRDYVSVNVPGFEQLSCHAEKFSSLLKSKLFCPSLKS
jgi:hypothetical protein